MKFTLSYDGRNLSILIGLEAYNIYCISDFLSLLWYSPVNT